MGRKWETWNSINRVWWVCQEFRRKLMERIIRIANKDYKMKASALTQFSYKDETGRSFLSDLQKLTAIKENANIDVLDDLTDVVLKIAYIMVKEGDKTQVQDYNEFLSQIDNLYDDADWIQEVLTLACSPLSRQLQTYQNQVK